MTTAETIRSLTAREQQVLRFLDSGAVWSITATDQLLHVLAALQHKGLVVYTPKLDRLGNPQGGHYSRKVK